MTPNPLHGAIGETQPHSATEGGVSEKPTMREALEALWREAITAASSTALSAAQRQRIHDTCDAARAALSAEEKGGWRLRDLEILLRAYLSEDHRSERKRLRQEAMERALPPSSKDEP